MPFQQPAFQPSPKERSRLVEWLRSASFHLKASRFLPLLEQNALQRGSFDVPNWTRRKPVLAEVIFGVAGCGLGLSTGGTWWERLFLAVLFAAVGVVGVYLLIWGWYVANAPRKQRDEARRYARALEQQVADFREWAARQVMAQDYYESEFHRADPSVIEHNLKHFKVAELGEHWKQGLQTIAGQLRDRGGGNNYDEMVANHIRVFEAKEDPYGDDEVRRLQWAMRNAAQELRGIVRREEQPPSPARPGEVPT